MNSPALLKSNGAPDGPSDTAALWTSEFTSRAEVVLRVIACLVVACLLWLYSGDLLGPVWAIAYLTALAACFAVLHPTRAPVAFGLGLGLYCTMAVVFTSLPLYLMASGDMTLAFCGGAALVALAVWTLFRKDPPEVVLHFDIARGWASVAVAAWVMAPPDGPFAAQAVVWIISGVVGVYYTMALRAKRANDAALTRLAQRSRERVSLEAADRLSGGIAHDFNNILTALRGSLELYHAVPSGPERDALVEEAREAGERASALVLQLQMVARRAPLEARPEPAAALLEQLSERVRPLLPARIYFETRLAAEEAMVMVDREHLLIALTGLVENAVEAMAGGAGQEIIVSCEICAGRAADGGDLPAEGTEDAHIRFAVADDGPGMSGELQTRALEPFFTSKQSGQASGLGLPAAQGFAAQSGGCLKLASTDNGTLVSVHLPMPLRS